MSQPGPVFPVPADDDETRNGVEVDATREDADGNKVLDPDSNDDLVNSADADEIAAGGDGT